MLEIIVVCINDILRFAFHVLRFDQICEIGIFYWYHAIELLLIRSLLCTA